MSQVVCLCTRQLGFTRLPARTLLDFQGASLQNAFPVTRRATDWSWCRKVIRTGGGLVFLIRDALGAVFRGLRPLTPSPRRFGRLVF